MNFRNDLDNEDEDSYSDDDFVEKVKMIKLIESIKRAEMTTENYAVNDII